MAQGVVPQADPTIQVSASVMVFDDGPCGLFLPTHSCRALAAVLRSFSSEDLLTPSFGERQRRDRIVAGRLFEAAAIAPAMVDLIGEWSLPISRHKSEEARAELPAAIENVSSKLYCSLVVADRGVDGEPEVIGLYISAVTSAKLAAVLGVLCDGRAWGTHVRSVVMEDTAELATMVQTALGCTALGADVVHVDHVQCGWLTHERSGSTDAGTVSGVQQPVQRHDSMLWVAAKSVADDGSAAERAAERTERSGLREKVEKVATTPSKQGGTKPKAKAKR